MCITLVAIIVAVFMAVVSAMKLKFIAVFISVEDVNLTHFLLRICIALLCPALLCFVFGFVFYFLFVCGFTIAICGLYLHVLQVASALSHWWHRQISVLMPGLVGD